MRVVSLILSLSVFLSACGSQNHVNDRSDDNNTNFVGSTTIDKSVNSIDKPEEKMTKNDTPNEPSMKMVSITGKAEKTDSELVISYTVKNHSDESIYLWDRMIGYTDQGQTIDQSSAYVFFEEPSTIRIIAADLPLPENMDIGRKEIPYARIFKGKSSLTGEIKLQLPIKEFSPYYGPLDEENQEAKETTEIRLIIGWTRSRKGMKITERNVGGDDVIAIRGGWSPPHQEIVEVRIPVKVDLLTYKTEFERQMPLQ